MAGGIADPRWVATLPGIITVGVGLILFYVAGSAVVLWRLVTTVRREPMKLSDGRKVLRYSRGWSFYFWASAAILLFVAAGEQSLWVLHPARFKAPCPPMVFAAGSLVGIIFGWVVQRLEVTYTNAEIRVRRLFGPSFAFSWREIVAARYSPLMSEWQFRLADGRVARVSRWMHGHRDFMETAQRTMAAPVPIPERLRRKWSSA